VDFVERYDASLARLPIKFLTCGRKGEIMSGKAMFSAVTLVGMAAFSNVSSAADLVNGQLKPCLAEKKAVGDVNSCGKKWKIGSGQAQVGADGTSSVQVSGLVLDDASVGNANGTPDGVDAIAVAVLCGDKVVAQADPVPLSKQGNANFEGTLRVPGDCAAPMVVVRERYEGKIGGWLAGTSHGGG
jgi:hypothetical protein